MRHVTFAACWWVLVRCLSSQLPPMEKIENVATSINNRLLDMLERDTGFENLTLSYQSNVLKQDYKQRNETDIVRQVASRISSVFSEKATALEKLRKEAEEIVKMYKFKQSLSTDEVDYLNMKSNSPMDLNERLQRDTDLNRSGIQMPIDIFDGYPEVINGIKWSDQLDNVFKTNYEDYPDLAWQFFGSNSGFIRAYPANRWKDIYTIPDLYDVRRRPWYVEGLTSPKDVLILMDTSGSVHGSTIAIMKLAVRTTIRMLGEDDYVNVAWFNNKAGWATCFQKLVQANSLNKKVLFQGIDNLRDRDMVNYTNALQFAFEEFAKFDKSKASHEGSECHKVIVIFTDGGTDKPDHILKKYNKDKKVRIFTFGVGSHASHLHVITKLACQNRGYFDTITTMGAVRTKIQTFPNVLVRPMALSNVTPITYSSVYTDAGGLGMVITISSPVYNRSEFSNHQSAVGVVGIDTPVRVIQQLIPSQKVGPNSYGFIINRNGFAVMHPDLKSQETYLDDAPTVDILDLEKGDNLTQLRQNMIDEKTGHLMVKSYIKPGDKNHVVHTNIRYYYAPVDGTPLSLGITFPGESRIGIRLTQDIDLDFDLEANFDDENILIAPWRYCQKLPFTAINMTEGIHKLVKLYKSTQSCDEELVQQLLFDIRTTRNMTRIWQKNNQTLTRERVAVFFGTMGGLTRFQSSGKADAILDLSDTTASSYFKKAMAYSTWVFMSSPNSETIITATKSITTFVNESTYKPAAYGINLVKESLQELLQEECLKLQEDVICYLLDDGAFIVSSNIENQQGDDFKFLGDVDPMLMWQLTNQSIYQRTVEYDYHAACPRHKTTTNAAPPRITALTITKIVQFIFHAVMDAALWLLMSGWNLDSSDARELGFNPKLFRTTYSCTTMQAIYHFGTQSNRAYHFHVDCANCTRSVTSVRLERTNLLLVTAIPPDCATSDCGEVDQLYHRPVEIAETHACEATPRYRRRPDKCYAHHAQEDSTMCDATTIFESRLTTLTLLPMVVILFGYV